MKMKSLMLAAAITVLAAGGTWAADPIGKVVGVQGIVSATDVSGGQRPLKLNSGVFQNDKVKTAAGAKVQIMFTDNTLFSQGENSEAELTEYLFSPEKKKDNAMGMKLGLGVFRVITGKITDLNPDRFRVKTGRATIGIRGCELAFVLTEKKDRILLIRVPEGKEIILDEIRNRGEAGGPVLAEGMSVPDEGIGFTLTDNRVPARSPITAEELQGIMRGTTPDDVIPPADMIEGGTESGEDEGETGESGENETPDSDQESAGETPTDGDEPPAGGDVPVEGDATPPATVEESMPEGTDMTGFTEEGTLDEGTVGTETGEIIQPNPSITDPGTGINNGTYDPVIANPTVEYPNLSGGNTTVPATDSGSTTDPVVEPVAPPAPAPLTIRGGGIGGLYAASGMNNELTDIWMYKDLIGTMGGGVFDGRIIGQHDNLYDSLPANNLESLLNFPLTDFAPGSTTYSGYDESLSGSVRLANDNLLQFWRRIDTADNKLTLSYGGYSADNYPASPGLPANSVIRYEIMFVEYPEHLPSTEPLLRLPENGFLYVNTQTHDFWIDPASSPALHGDKGWLQFFGQEWQGVGHVGGGIDPATGELGGGMAVAGFLDTSAGAIQPADTGVTVHNGGYAVGASFCDTPASGLPNTHSFYSGEDNVSVVVNMDTADNNANAHIGVFQNPLTPGPQDIVMSAPNQSFYVMNGMYEAHYETPAQSTLVRGETDTGTDWGWGEWNGQREVDYGGGVQTEQIEGRYVTGRTLTSTDYSGIFQGAASFDMTGTGSAMGYIGNDNYRSRVDGMATIHIMIPGGSGAATWDGAFSLNNANGDTLVVNYSPLSQNISSGGNLSSSVTPSFYELQTGGFMVTAPLIEHQMDGSLVGPGTGANPITGAIGSGNFRHLDGHFSEFTYGTDLH